MQHEPCCFLGDIDITSKLAASNAYLVTGDQVDCHKPPLQLDFVIVKNSAMTHTKLGDAIAAFMAIVGEGIDYDRTAMGTCNPIRPANRTEVVNAFVFIIENLHHAKQA